MEDDLDFKQLWGKQKIEIPVPEELIKKAQKYKRKALIRLIATNILLFATCIGISLIWIYFQPDFFTTKLGMVLCIIAMLAYLAFHNTLAPLLINNRLEQDTKSELQLLLKLKEKQRFQQITLLNGYFILLSVGLSFYMYEYVARMTMPWAIFSYLIVLFWIALNAFYFRPRIIKKQQVVLDELIDKVKYLNDQLSN